MAKTRIDSAAEVGRQAGAVSAASGPLVRLLGAIAADRRLATAFCNRHLRRFVQKLTQNRQPTLTVADASH
jgi:hypothetical protein